MRPSDLSIAGHAVNTVCRHFGLSPSQIEGRRRTWSMVWPRWCVYALTAQSLDLSSPAMGALFNRDHTTILHGLTQHRNLISTNRKARLEWEELKREFGKMGYE